MRRASYTSEGIIIATKNIKDADKLVYVLSKNYGVRVLFTKGARKIRSRKRGHLSVFNQIKFTADEGDGIDFMKEVSSQNEFQNIRKDLKKVSVAYFYCETVGKLVKAVSDNHVVFNILYHHLQILNSKTITANGQRKDFIQELLTELGFWPSNRKLADPDKLLMEIAEKDFSTVRVGKKVLS